MQVLIKKGKENKLVMTLYEKKLINDVYINLKNFWLVGFFYLAIIVIIIATNSEGFDAIIVMSLCIIFDIYLANYISNTKIILHIIMKNEIVQKKMD
ncbi:MAG: hypothetical protein L6U99_04675 [Clostridium sp.]|nr:MAG: hypothetical protein L6U99_04675 [Clostridium sp.]